MTRWKRRSTRPATERLITWHAIADAVAKVRRAARRRPPRVSPRPPRVLRSRRGNAMASRAGSAVAKMRAKYEKGRVGSKSKTGRSECSQAVSDWKTHGMTAAIAAVLGKCHAKGHAEAGQALAQHK